MGQRHRDLAWLLLLAWAAGSCSRGTEPDCIALPCPMPMAAVLTVTSSKGGPVPELTMTVSGPVSTSGPCTVGESATTCVLPGLSGSYSVRLTSPGFQEKALSVV